MYSLFLPGALSPKGVPSALNLFSSLATQNLPLITLHLFHSLSHLHLPTYSLAFSLRPAPPLAANGQASKETIMATRASRKKTSAPSTVTKHPIRIVPLYPPVRDAATPTPKLTYSRFSFCEGFLLPAAAGRRWSASNGAPRILWHAAEGSRHHLSTKKWFGGVSLESCRVGNGFFCSSERRSFSSQNMLSCKN